LDRNSDQHPGLGSGKGQLRGIPRCLEVSLLNVLQILRMRRLT